MGFAATLIRFPLAGVMSAFQVGGKVAFTHVKVEPREMIEKIAEMGDVVRRSGPLGLEGIEVTDPNLKKGAQMIADGYDASLHPRFHGACPRPVSHPPQRGSARVQVRSATPLRPSA